MSGYKAILITITVILDSAIFQVSKWQLIEIEQGYVYAYEKRLHK